MGVVPTLTIRLDKEPFNSDLFSWQCFAFTPYVNDGFYSHRSVYLSSVLFCPQGPRLLWPRYKTIILKH